MTARSRLSPGRLLAAATLIVLLLVMTAQLGARLLGLEELDGAEVAGPEPAWLDVQAEVPTRVRVAVDEEEVFSGVLLPEKPIHVEAGRVAVVELEELDRVRIRYDGRQVVPLGVLEGRRRLIFVDDL